MSKRLFRMVAQPDTGFVMWIFAHFLATQLDLHSLHISDAAVRTHWPHEAPLPFP